MSDDLPIINQGIEDLSKKSKQELLDIARQNHLKIPDTYLRGPKSELADFITQFLEAIAKSSTDAGVSQMPANLSPRAGFDIRVTELPTAKAVDTVDGSVLHGVSDADDKDYKYPFSALKTFFQSGISVPVDSVFGRTGAVVAAEGDYDLGQLGDVTLSSPSNGQVLLYNGSGWVNGSSLSSVDLGYTPAEDKGTVTNDAGDDAVIPVVDGTNAGLMTPTQKNKLDGIEIGADANVGTNLGNTPTTDTVKVTSSTGDDTVIAAASTSEAGVMTKDQATKLAGIADGAQVNVATNLTYTAATDKGTVNSSTGSNADIPAVDSNAGLMTPTQKTKLDGIESGAQVNVGTNLTYTASTTGGTVNSSTGSNASIPLAVNNGNAGLFSGTDKKKLDGISDGAGVNVPTNLGYTAGTSDGKVTSSTGTDATIPLAVKNGNAGLFSGTEKNKLEGIASGAQVNVDTNLGNTPGTSTVEVTSSTGSNTTLPAASTTKAGVMTKDDRIKLNNIPSIASGSNVGDRLRWDGSKWVATDLFY